MSVVWQPSEKYVERANVTRFMRAHGIETVTQLVRRSRDDFAWFWDALVQDLGIEFLHPYERVVDTSRGIEWARWFVGGKINLVHNCVDRWAAQMPNSPALVWEGEDGDIKRLTYGEVHQLVNQITHGLKHLGIRTGDTVGIFMPLVPEAAATIYACAKLGAIAVPIFSGFEPDAVAARLNHARSKLLITADGFLRRGRLIPMKEIADQAIAQVPTVRAVVVWPRLHRTDMRWDPSRDIAWDEAFTGHPDDVASEPLDADHPALLCYTSGTTGRPKGAVLTHGGLSVTFAREAAYYLDVHRGETFSWITDLGWIVGPLLIIGGMSMGSVVFLYDGFPAYPHVGRLWDMIDRHGINIVGVSPSLIRGLLSADSNSVHRHDLSSLRIIGVTGEPWTQGPWMWLFSEIGRRRCPLINISGGTEVGGAFLGTLPITPLKPCSLGLPALGMDVDIFDPHGRPVLPGQVGELVCKNPWPGMTRGLWRDPDRYLETYWRRWPGVWEHGDWASQDEDGFWYIHGRSDDTLNIAGKRLGPAEIEGALSENPIVREAAAVGMPHEIKGEVIWCFVILRSGAVATDQLATGIADLVGARVSKAFRPERVVFVEDLPRTRSAKILRRVVRAIALGKDPGDISSLENPDSIGTIRDAVNLLGPG